MVLVLCVPAMAQDAGVRVCVADEMGARLVGVSVAGSVTGADGCARIVGASAVTRDSVAMAGFAFVSSRTVSTDEIEVVMRPASVEQQVTVTASRGALDVGATASSVRVLSYQQLQQTPAFTLDDQMKTVPGFQLYRRSSSWVSNPTSQGVSLRGLGSTAASRTLMVSDQVPLNDPFGGWVHWDEIPQMAVRSVSVLRGGAADLYGSSAIGGVVDVQPEIAGGDEKKRFAATVDAAGANEGTSLVDGLVKGGAGAYDGLAAATFFRTAGFIQTAPSMRGSVDENANVHDQSGRVELRRSGSTGNSIFIRGNMLNEARENGTPDTTNGTRIWRYVGGGDVTTEHAGRGFLRMYGTDEDYRQSFSSIAADRNSEKLTRLQRAPVQEIGAAVQWAKEFRGHLTAAAGADVHDVRATDNESPITNNVATSVISISSRQRETGAYGEAIWQPGRWSAALSTRVDSFSTFDAKSIVSTTQVVTPEPMVAETVVSPRLGLVRELGHGLSLTGSVNRAFRGPTMNELYRTGQVGSQTTLPNAALRSERATGFEFGARAETSVGALRGGYFWTEVNRPVDAVLQSQTATTQTLIRENLGQIRSRGWTVEADSREWMHAQLSTGYQYANATVTSFSAETTLVGKWIPQVPRNTGSAKLQVTVPRVAYFNVTAFYTGHAFDDTENTDLLHGYARFDVYGERKFGSRVMVYGSIQNLLNRAIEVGRTPLLTLGAPRTAMLGLRFALNGLR